MRKLYSFLVEKGFTYALIFKFYPAEQNLPEVNSSLFIPNLGFTKTYLYLNIFEYLNIKKGDTK